MLLLAACLSSVSVHAQKPSQKRQVKDSTPAAPATASALPVGSYHALIVGINNYQSLPKLQTAVNDATALAKLLQEQYGFADIKLLPNATRNQILLAVNDFKRNLPENSNLLIYYAGHGYKDPGTKIASGSPWTPSPTTTSIGSAPVPSPMRSRVFTPPMFSLSQTVAIREISFAPR